MDTALVFDDDPFHIELAHEVLSSTGAKLVSAASDGAAARKLLAESGPFNLLLLDLHMPDCDGVEFLDHLRKIDFRGAVVIVSAADTSVRNGAAQLGAAYGLNVAGVLAKPLTAQKLAPALANI